MSDSHYDLVVIGGGPAGYAASLQAGRAGLSVALVERDKVGGTCLHRGCIPAKELLETAAVRRTVAEADQFGVQVSETGFDLGIAQERKQRIVDQLYKGLSGLLKASGVTVVQGTGRLGADRTVHVSLNSGGADSDAGDSDGTDSDSATTLTGKHVVLAAGSIPRSIPGLELDYERVITSDQVLELEEVPERVAIVGGGAIGCEFASMLADFGSEVTVLEYADQLIPGVDPDIAKALGRSFKKRGIKVRTKSSVVGYTPQASKKNTKGSAKGNSSGLTVHFEPVNNAGKDAGKADSSAIEDLSVDVLAVCVGRKPFGELAGVLGENESGVEVDERGYVKIDEMCRTSVPGVYAIGDLTDTPQLAHVGFAEAIVVVRDILGENPPPVDYINVPWAIYCHPEVAFAGLTEQAAKDAGYDVVTSTHRFAGNSRAMIVNSTEGLVKIVAQRTPDTGRAGRILGVHMMGPWVTEQLGQGYLAVNWEATVEEVAAFITPHPTLSELFGEAMLDLAGRPLHG